MAASCSVAITPAGEPSRRSWSSSSVKGVELTLVFGNYTMLALAINAFDSDLPPNRTEPLLPI